MADGALSFFLQNLKELGQRIYTLHRDARRELNELQVELETLQIQLEEAAVASRKCHEGLFKDWMKRIREVVYEAEDLIDDFATQEIEHGIVNTLVKLPCAKIDLAAKLKTLRAEKIKPMSNEFNISLASSTSTASDNATRNRRQVSHLAPKTMVGFGDVIETLIANVRENTPAVEVISITGMAGLGKTTVAWKIFHDPQIEHDFPTRIWIVVSEDYKPKNIYLKILSKFTNQNMSSSQQVLTSQDLSSMDIAELANKSKDYLSQVKFLLVVDDVWTKEAWDDVKRALPMLEGSGKVLITSRVNSVANYATTRKPPHQLRFLDEDESWKLLQYEVYGNETDLPQDLESIEWRISQKCGGLPLAIVVIGGIVRANIVEPKSRKAAWLDLDRRTKEHLMEADTNKIMEKCIALSYHPMPCSLRNCLLYFGAYPEDKDICVWKLTRLWIAEGLIKDELPGRSLEEIAAKNLKKLIRRNLVMVVKSNRRGEVKTCRAHGMIREFCKMKAVEEKFFMLISKRSEEECFIPNVDKVHEFHRISLHSHGLNFLEQKPKGPYTRSFLCFSKHKNGVHPSSLKSIAEAFERLRILEVSEIKFPEYDLKFTKLNHLRYISLAAGEGFKSLPKAIASLWSLQTIVIDTYHDTFEIKADVGDLKRLRHVKTKAGIVFSCKKKCESNYNLQTLDRLSPDSCKDGDVLSKTPHLQTLGICGDLTSLQEATFFKMLYSLTKMKMINISERPLFGFLAHANFPPNLKILTLSATNLDWSYMKTLGHLPLLEVLKLKDNAFKGDEWKIYHGDFREIQYLHIDRCALSTWNVEEGSLPKLATLFLSNCKNLRAVPLNLAKTLQTLEIGEGVLLCARRSAEIMLEKSKTRQIGELELKFVGGT